MKNSSCHRIAILSDTHDLLRPETVSVLQTCEMILHAGDFSSPEILDELKRIAPVHAVRGNNDREWAEGLARELDITLFGLRIYMIHDRKEGKQDLEGIDLFIYGHSHKYEQKTVDGVCFLNPGSCGPRRFWSPVTMAVLQAAEDGRTWSLEKIDLLEEARSAAPPQILTAENPEQTVQAILRDMKAGKKVENIARRLGLQPEFVEQVCRIYVTHPGVDAQGIVSKMEVNALFRH